MGVSKKPVMHKLVKGLNTTTECGISSDNTKATWRGVTCKRCLKVRDRQKGKFKKGGK